MKRSKKFWEDFGERMVDAVLRALGYWCWNVSGDPVTVCYQIHSDRSLYELAEEFADWSASRITSKDLEILEEMPENIYKKFNTKLHKEIEKIIDMLKEEYGSEELEETELTW